MNNNEAVNAVIPQEIQTAIDNYKNQATTWGLEVKRLEMLKAQTEITLSKLQAEVTDKKNQIISLDERIKKSTEQLETARLAKIKVENDMNEKTAIISNKEHEIAVRLQEVAKRESANRKIELMFVEKENIRKEELRKMEIEKIELQKKVNLIKDFSVKL